MVLYMKDFGDVLAYKADGKACAANVMSAVAKLVNMQKTVTLDFAGVENLDASWCEGFFSALVEKIGLPRFKTAVMFSNLKDDNMATIKGIFSNFEKE